MHTPTGGKKTIRDTRMV